MALLLNGLMLKQQTDRPRALCAHHWAERFVHIVCSILPTTAVISISLTRETKPREVRTPAQGPPGGTWQSKESVSVAAAPEPTFSSVT